MLPPPRLGRVLRAVLGEQLRHMDEQGVSRPVSKDVVCEFQAVYVAHDDREGEVFRAV